MLFELHVPDKGMIVLVAFGYMIPIRGWFHAPRDRECLLQNGDFGAHVSNHVVHELFVVGS